MEAGKLYICEEFFLLLYPDQEACADAAAVPVKAAVPVAVPVAFLAVDAATYWTRKLGKSVLYAKKNIPILVLNSKEKFYEVLAGDRKGWIIYQDWLGIKEIDYA